MSDKLAVFDFDQTLIDGDSDSVVIAMLDERPSDLHINSAADWTPYMNKVFGLVHEAGWSKEDVLDRVGRLESVRGAERLLRALCDADWECMLLTDSNSVFVQHWLKVHGLKDLIARVITNPAHWEDGRLLVSPYEDQYHCARCPRNLCKGTVLSMLRRDRACVVYVGDGANDVCPMTQLTEQDMAFPREGYACHKMLSAMPPLRARTLPWRDHRDVLSALFPHSPD